MIDYTSIDSLTGKIIWGDCLDIMRRLPDKSVNLIITDPPYGVNKIEWDKNEYWKNLIINFGKIIKNKLTHDGILIVFTSTRYLYFTLLSIPCKYRWQFISASPNNMIRGDIGFAKYTSALIFSDRKSINVNAQDLRNYYAGTKELKNNNHPTPKPLECIKYLVNKFSNPNDLILDPFSGSGTTAVACHELGRRWILIEKELRYVGLSRRRLDAVIAQQRLFV